MYKWITQKYTLFKYTHDMKTEILELSLYQYGTLRIIQFLGYNTESIRIYKFTDRRFQPWTKWVLQMGFESTVIFYTDLENIRPHAPIVIYQFLQING